MKKIAVVCKDMTSAGGAEKMAVQLINALKGEYEMHLIMLHGQKNKTLFDLSPDVPVHILDEGSFERIRVTFKKCRRSFRNIIKENKFDYVMLEATYTNFLGIIMGLGLHTKFIVCDHGSIQSQLDNKSITMLRRISARFAYKVVVLTESSLKAYRRIFKIKADKITYIYNWIDPQNINEDYTYAADSKCIISVGRFVIEKRFETIAEIGKKVFDKYPDWQWHIYGDGKCMDQVKSSIEKAGLQDNIKLMGQRSDIEELYKEYSFYVLTSTREGLPLVLLEAKANHLPIISYDIETGPNEIINDNVNGFLVESQNIDEMANKIITLISNRNLRKEFSSHAYDDIYRFRMDEILNKWREILK